MRMHMDTLDDIVIYGIGSFWAVVVILKELLKYLQAPSEYFQIKPRPNLPAVLSPTAQQQHKRAQLSNGIALHYVTSGDSSKPMILFVHGFPEFWYSWRHQLAGLSSDYFCVAIDMRGYGDSSKPNGVENYLMSELVSDIKLLIDEEFGGRKVTLVAHDWGGLIAWKFAEAHAGMLDRLVIVNAPNLRAITEHSEWKQLLRSWYMFLFQLPCLPELIMRRRDLESLDLMFKGVGLSAADVEAWKYTFGAPHAFEYPINYYRANMKPVLAEVLGLRKRDENQQNNFLTKLPSSVPVLMIWGVNEKFAAQKLGEVSGEYCENFRFVLVKDAGHWVPQERPAEVNKIITEFIRNNDVLNSK